MVAFKIFLKVLPYMWPFIREMVLGRKSLLAALRDNKKKVFFITLIIVSFGLNFLTVPRLVSMSVQYVTLDKRYKELEARYNRVTSSSKYPNANGLEQQIQIKETNKERAKEKSPATEKKPSPKKEEDKGPASKADVDQIKQQFEKIRQREEKELRNPITD